MAAKKDAGTTPLSTSSTESKTEEKSKKQPAKSGASSSAKIVMSGKKAYGRMPFMQNRELSWLNFNKRVLDQGEDPTVPLLERLTFVSIFSSNLQEFFMVRVGSLTDLSLIKKEIRDNKTLMTPQEQLDAIYARCHLLYREQERIYTNIQDQLSEFNIRNLAVKDLSDDQRDYLRAYLEDKVIPYLSPQIINARHPFPHFENGKLYVLLRLNEELPQDSGEDADGKAKKKSKNVGAGDSTFGLIPLPSQAKRLIKLPGEGTQFILLEQALKLIVDDVFSMYSTKRASVICVTRNADIDPNADIDEIDYDYREHMKRILKKRARLTPVRLETDTELSEVTKQFLLPRLDISEDQVFITNVPLDMSYAWGLPDVVDNQTAEKLTNTPFTPAWPACLDRNRSIMQQVIEGDKLLSYPYQSMDPFITLLREAAVDPSVLSIKITLYRLASQSHLAEALLAAAENGKEVTALFELRARFDESNNIEWSQRFEQAGAHVIYGFRDLKVHSKICVITRTTENGLQHITQLGTGNYNEKTSKLYTDFSFMTADQRIGKDAAEFFKNMSLENISTNYTTLSVAPLQIKPMILDKIDEQIARAKAGLPNGLIFKTNSITDKDTIDKIVEASQAGVHTTLFVRGISCIVPGIKGYTENVEVVSIVGRLLEHSRIYGFGVREDMEIFLSSADLMTRNMDKRVEIAWPILNQEQKDIVLNYLDVSLSDTAKLRMLESNLEYTPLGYFSEETATGKIESFNSQAFLIQKAEVDYEESALLYEEASISRTARSHVNHIISTSSARVRAAAEDFQNSLDSGVGTAGAAGAARSVSVAGVNEAKITAGKAGAIAATATAGAAAAAQASATPTLKYQYPLTVPLHEGDPGVVTQEAPEATVAQKSKDGNLTVEEIEKIIADYNRNHGVDTAKPAHNAQPAQSAEPQAAPAPTPTIFAEAAHSTQVSALESAPEQTEAKTTTDSKTATEAIYAAFMEDFTSAAKGKPKPEEASSNTISAEEDSDKAKANAVAESKAETETEAEAEAEAPKTDTLEPASSNPEATPSTPDSSPEEDASNTEAKEGASDTKDKPKEEPAEASDVEAQVEDAIEVELLPPEEPVQTVQIQLVEQYPSKPSFWKRLKFLFTGHF